MVATGPEVVMAARSAGAEGEKSVGMAGVARLVSGSKGAAEQTRSRETALRVRRARFPLTPTRLGRGDNPAFSLQLA